MALSLLFKARAFKASTSPVLISSLSIERVTLRVGFLTTRILKDSVKPSTVADTVVLPVFFVSKFPNASNSATPELLDSNFTFNSYLFKSASSNTSTDIAVAVCT